VLDLLEIVELLYKLQFNYKNMASTIPVTTPNTNNPEDITKKFP
jgi:hypothetical protein